MHVRTSKRLTRTGPKRLHILYMYVLSKFNAYNMNARTHTCMHARVHICTAAYQGNGTEEKVFENRKVFKEDLKELTEVDWQTKTHAQLRIRAMGLKKNNLKSERFSRKT